MTEINIALLLVSTGIALTGFAGKKVLDVDPSSPKPMLKRVTRQGWAFLLLLVVGLALGINKELRSFEGRAKAVYPDFYSLVEDVTGYSEDQWTRFFSYRMSLRLLLQKAHKKLIGGELPPSMELTLKDLGRAGAIDDGLCSELDYLRWHTYSTEWGALGKAPDPDIRAKLRQTAADILGRLDRKIATAERQSLKPNPNTVCGSKPL